MGSTRTFRQTETEVLDYDFDFTDWLGADTITSSAVTSSPSGLTTSTSTTTTVAKVWCSGGTVGVTYDVVVTIQTTAGRTKERCLYLKVIDDPCD
jgi:hypothetical protein